MSLQATTPTSTPTVSERALLLPLAVIHARRYAAHPLFLIGVALLTVSTLAVIDDGPDGYGSLEDGVAVAFLIGVLGIVVGYRLTTNEDRAANLLASAPVSRVTRTLGLFCACVVPLTIGLIWFVTRLIGYAVWLPRPELVEAVGGWSGMVIITFSTSVMCAVGGPLLGVAAGRWLHFPGAGVLVAVLVTVATAFFVSGALTPTLTNNAPMQTIATLMPFTEWVLVDFENGVELLRGVRDGAPAAHLIYQLGLCALVVCVAVLKDSRGSSRARWIRATITIAITSALAASWAVLG